MQDDATALIARAVLPVARAQAAQCELLTRITIDDVLGAFGLDHVRCGRGVLEALVGAPARRFARQIVTYDALVGSAGLQAGHAWLLSQFVARVVVHGREHLPPTGPLLIVANHPGSSDGSALLAVLGRPDLRVVVAPHAFLRALPQTSRYLFFRDPPPAVGLALLHAVVRHLRGGGAVLLFPAGAIEPDPAVHPGAAEALQRWSRSSTTLARLVPGLVVVPTAVWGVLARGAAHHPLTRLRRTSAERRRLAALFQMLIPAYHRVSVQVRFGAPIQAAAATGDVHAQVCGAMRQLLGEATR